MERMQQAMRADGLPPPPPKDEEDENKEPREVIAESRSVTREQSREPTRDREEGWDSSLKSFMDRKPPIFRGRDDPSLCMQWLHKMRKIFRSINFIELQKVSYAALKLDGDAI